MLRSVSMREEERGGGGKRESHNNPHHVLTHAQVRGRGGARPPICTKKYPPSPPPSHTLTSQVVCMRQHLRRHPRGAQVPVPYTPPHVVACDEPPTPGAGATVSWASGPGHTGKSGKFSFTNRNPVNSPVNFLLRPPS